MQFACQNSGTHLNRASVIGKSLWQFVYGVEVRQIYGMIFKAVRTKQQSMVFKFRCDSPATRRWFQLKVAPLQHDELMLSIHSIREVTRNPVHILDPDVSRGDSLLTVCSWCIKGRLPTDEWVELEEVINRLDLLGKGPVPPLRHGLCSECHCQIENELKNLR